MSFPIKHTAYDIKIISTKNRSILITGSLDREKGFFGEFKPNSTPVPDTNNPGTSQFVARYDEKGNLKWIKDLYDEFDIKQPLVHLQKDGKIKIVGRLSGTENIGDISIASIDENDAYIAEINVNGKLTKAEVIRTTNHDTPKLIFAPDNSYYSLSSHLDDDDRDIVLRKFNNDHQLEWQKTGDSLGLTTIISHELDNRAAFTQTDNSLTFELRKRGTFGNPSTQHIGRVSSKGNLEWNIDVENRIVSISPSKDGGAIFLHADMRSGIHEESMTKVDSSGNIQWKSDFSRNDKDGYFEIEEKRNK